jgi:hypothetical protein
MTPGNVMLQIQEVDEKIHALYNDGEERSVVINSKQEFLDLLVKIGHSGKGVLISSTLHFPEEYTDDPQVVALAEELS